MDRRGYSYRKVEAGPALNIEAPLRRPRVRRVRSCRPPKVLRRFGGRVGEVGNQLTEQR